MASPAPPFLGVPAGAPMRGSGFDPRWLVLVLESIRKSCYEWILRLECFDALCDISIINIAPVDFHEVVERCLFVAGRLVGGRQLVVHRHLRIFIGRSYLQRLLVPLDRRFRYTFLYEAMRQPRVGLHDLAKCISPIDGMTHFLQLPD